MLALVEGGAFMQFLSAAEQSWARDVLFDIVDWTQQTGIRRAWLWPVISQRIDGVKRVYSCPSG